MRAISLIDLEDQKALREELVNCEKTAEMCLKEINRVHVKYNEDINRFRQVVKNISTKEDLFTAAKDIKELVKRASMRKSKITIR